jgi:hypothetical protein
VKYTNLIVMMMTTATPILLEDAFSYVFKNELVQSSGSAVISSFSSHDWSKHVRAYFGVNGYNVPFDETSGQAYADEVGDVVISRFAKIAADDVAVAAAAAADGGGGDGDDGCAGGVAADAAAKFENRVEDVFEIKAGKQFL